MLSQCNKGENGNSGFPRAILGFSGYISLGWIFAYASGIFIGKVKYLKVIITSYLISNFKDGFSI